MRGMDKKKYRIADKNRADIRALLRGVVSAYLLYLAYQLCFGKLEDTTFPLAARIAAGIVIALGAAAFGVYTWRSYRADCKSAELTDEELEELRREREE